MTDESGDKYNSGGKTIADGIHCGGGHGRRIQFFAQCSVVIKHIAFHKDGSQKNNDDYGRKGQFFRVDDLGDRAFYELNTHEQD